MSDFEDKLKVHITALVELIRKERMDFPRTKFQMVRPEKEIRSALCHPKHYGLDAKTLRWVLFENSEMEIDL